MHMKDKQLIISGRDALMPKHFLYCTKTGPTKQLSFSWYPLRCNFRKSGGYGADIDNSCAAVLSKGRPGCKTI